MNKKLTAGLLLGGLLAGALLSSLLLSALKQPELKPAPQQPQFGALSSPDISSPFLSFGGVRRWAVGGIALNQASTTLCSLVSPVSTSTLVSASVQINTGTTTAIQLEMAKSTLMDATTTRISLASLASGNRMTLTAFVASTTGAYGALAQQHTADEQDLVFAPSTRLNVKYGGGKGSLNVLVGTCNATWEQN